MIVVATLGVIACVVMLFCIIHRIIYGPSKNERPPTSSN